MDMQMRAWARVDLDAIEENYRAIRSLLPETTRFLAPVKANAYGHGAVPVARLMEEAGCDYLAVACLEEAVQLRQAGIGMPILILGHTPPEEASELIRLGLTQTVHDAEYARALSDRALEGRIKAHLKLDSGMGRLGFSAKPGQDPMADVASALACPGLDYEGVFTHFAVSDTPGGEDYTLEQFAAFTGTVERIRRELGKEFEIRHCANSGAVVSFRQTCLDMVRPGIALYGCYPGAETAGLTLRPAMSFHARIAQIKPFLPGQSVSYGRTFTADRPMRVAVVTVGYGDGLHRVLSGRMDMLIRGRRCPQIGRICMDLCMADVTELPEAKVGDAVTVFGADGGAVLPVEEQAEKAGTISYELLCAVSPRIHRIYTRHGREQNGFGGVY